MKEMVIGVAVFVMSSLMILGFVRELTGPKK